MTYDLRWVLVLLGNLFVILLVAEVNHYAAPLSLQFYLGGLLLTFAALRLQLRQGLMATGITALVMDALNPLSFGYTFFLMLGCHAVVFSVRGQFPRETPRWGILIALLLNLVLMVAFTLATFRHAPAPGAFLGRAFTDGVLSLIAVLLVGPWFLSLQKCSLAMIGIDLDAEQREAQ
jgi:uncharacterized membrane protein